MHWGLWVSLAVLVLIILWQVRTSGYAPPRDENTLPPYTEAVSNAVVTDSQTDVFMDAGGFLNQREHPMTQFLQSNALAGTDYGNFVGLESSSGNAPMYVIPEGGELETTPENSGEYIPNITSREIPLLGDTLPPIPEEPVIPPMTPEPLNTAVSVSGLQESSTFPSTTL